MEAYPFLIREDGSGDRLDPAHPRGQTYDEAWLQELLRQHPDILPAAEIEPVFSPLVSIGRRRVGEMGQRGGAAHNGIADPANVCTAPRRRCRTTGTLKSGDDTDGSARTVFSVPSGLHQWLSGSRTHARRPRGRGLEERGLVAFGERTRW